METSKMNGINGRGVQTFLFAEQLHKQLNAMETKAGCVRRRLEKQANSYMEMGLTADEIKELVAIDSKSVVKEARDAFVDEVAGADEVEMFQWDYSVMDSRGRKWSASSYGLRPVTAANVEEATAIASRSLRMMLSTEDEESVVDVERIAF